MNALPGVVNTTLFTDGKTQEQIAPLIQRTPHGHLGEPEDIAQVIAQLCDKESYRVNGQAIYANGGIA